MYRRQVASLDDLLSLIEGRCLGMICSPLGFRNEKKETSSRELGSYFKHTQHLGSAEIRLALFGGSPVLLNTQVASDNLADLRRNAVAIVNGAAYSGRENCKTFYNIN